MLHFGWNLNVMWSICCSTLHFKGTLLPDIITMFYQWGCPALKSVETTTLYQFMDNVLATLCECCGNATPNIGNWHLVGTTFMQCWVSIVTMGTDVWTEFTWQYFSPMLRTDFGVMFMWHCANIVAMVYLVQNDRYIEYFICNISNHLHSRTFICANISEQDCISRQLCWWADDDFFRH